jgi:uncharacterized membrane protein YfcA
MVDLAPIQIGLLLAAVFAVAFFYSSVGHGGATGYLAALALLGVAPGSARVAVLIANVLVASLAWWRFRQAGYFDWHVLLPFAVVSVPCAWLGSRVQVSPQIYKIVLGTVLTAAGVVLLLRSRWQTDDVALHKFFLPPALFIGTGLGFLAGLTGILSARAGKKSPRPGRCSGSRCPPSSARCSARISARAGGAASPSAGCWRAC